MLCFAGFYRLSLISTVSFYIYYKHFDDKMKQLQAKPGSEPFNYRRRRLLKIMFIGHCPGAMHVYVFCDLINCPPCDR